MIKIGIFEDHPIVLKSIVQLISEQKDIKLVFTANTKKQFYSDLKKHLDVDVLVVDMLSTDVFGMEVYEYLNKHYPLIKVIAFTTLTSPILVENFLTLGVKGYVNKNQETEDLIEAIKLVNQGDIYLPQDYSFLSKTYGVNKQMILSEREVQIVQLISREFTTSDIAQQLELSVNTIENHRKKIFEKLNVKNVAGMVREAAKLGYL